MLRTSTLTIVVLAAAWLNLSSQKPNEIFSLETMGCFQKLVECSDTQKAQLCWQKHGPSILSSAKPNLSSLANQVVHVCLSDAESRQPHDLQFLLSVQKCFHLADLIDLGPPCQSVRSSPKGVSPLELMISISQALILFYLVISVPDQTIARLWEATNVAYESVSWMCQFLTAMFFPLLRLIVSKYFFLRRLSDDINAEFSRAMHDGGFAGAVVGAKKRVVAKIASGAKSGDSTGCVLSSASKMTPKKTPSFQSNNGVYDALQMGNKTSFECACEVSDYESHNACGLESDDDCFEVDEQTSQKCETISRDSSKCDKGDSKSLLHVLAVDNSPNSKILAANGRDSVELTTMPGETTTSAELEEVDLLISSRPCISGKAFPQGTITVMTDENDLRVHEPGAQPSFDISTESGRADMKAYVTAKMKLKKPIVGRGKSGDYRSLSRNDRDNSKMRRVYIADKGWVWLTNQERNGVRFVTGDAVKGAGS